MDALQSSRRSLAATWNVRHREAVGSHLGRKDRMAASGPISHSELTRSGARSRDQRDVATAQRIADELACRL